MVSLVRPTRSTWVHEALSALDVVLLDHAHCEKKAASMALNMIFRYGDKPEIMVPLSRLAREELRHFELVLEVLQERDIDFVRLMPSPYAPGLMGIVRSAEPDRFLDTLLASSIIEARSCERMKLLADGLDTQGDTQLAAFYRSLLASEARHTQTYLKPWSKNDWTRCWSMKPRCCVHPVRSRASIVSVVIVGLAGGCVQRTQT